jgi:hypothetical protein
VNKRTVFSVLLALGAATFLATAGWSLFHYWPRTLDLYPRARLPVAEIEDGRLSLRVRGSILVGEVARYDDELFAYLMLEYLQSQPGLRDRGVWITSSTSSGRLNYALLIPFGDDLSGAANLYALKLEVPFLSPVCRWFDVRAVPQFKSRTQAFVRAYNYPAYRKLERLSRRQVIAYTRRFIRFKSITDPRVLRRIEPVPHPLTTGQAQRLAEDIVDVTKFYSLPLDFFLGIGAMENNYLNVNGDLLHTTWKRRPAKDDIVIQRRRGRVLVLDEATGVWQITRETLRHAHKLYLKDTRDYDQLPVWLRPPKELNLNDVTPGVLTTYAGLLFRELLDLYSGDVEKAVGAYNGGPRNPNLQYADGVRTVAEYARSVFEQAAVLHAQEVADTPKPTPPSR